MIPEKSVSDKVEHHKAVNRTLRKRIDNLEKRILVLEERMNKFKNLLPEEVPKNFGTPKKKKETEKEKFLKGLKETFGSKE